MYPIQRGRKNNFGPGINARFPFPRFRRVRGTVRPKFFSRLNYVFIALFATGAVRFTAETSLARVATAEEVARTTRYSSSSSPLLIFIRFIPLDHVCTLKIEWPNLIARQWRWFLFITSQAVNVCELCTANILNIDIVFITCTQFHRAVLVCY